MDKALANFTDVLDDEIYDSQPISLTSSIESNPTTNNNVKFDTRVIARPTRGTGQRGHLRSTEEIDLKYRDVFTYPYFNLVQSNVIDNALYSDKSIVVCAPTGSGKTVIFEMAIVQLLMELEDKHYTEDFKIIYMAPVKALCTERLTEWYPKFNKLGLLCIEATGDTDVDFTQLKPYNIIITTPEKWDMLTRRWRDHRSLVEVIKLFLIDEVHILNDEARGPVLEAVVSRMKTIESSAQSVHRIELLQHQLHGSDMTHKTAPSIRFVAVSATVSNPEDVANWLGTTNKPAVFHKFGDETRPVKLKRIVEGYPCPQPANIFKFDIFLNYKLWPIIQKYHCGKPTLIFCNTRKSVTLTAEALSREITINFSAEQKAKLTALASTIKTKFLQSLVLSGVGCHHAGLLYEERQTIELAFRNRDLPILITTTTLAMGVNLPAHLVIIKNTQQYVNGAYQEYSISTVLQMVGRAGRPQFDTEATAVIMTRLADKARYQALVGGCEPLQSYLHKRLPENLNSEAALGTVADVAQCVQWLRSTFLYVRAARDPKKYLNLPQNSPQHLISKKIEELCVIAMNCLASSGLITMDEASCIESTEAGRLMSIYYLDLETMKHLMKIEGSESLDRLLTLICESHELADMHLRVDERRYLNALNRNSAAATIRFPMKGKITTRQMKLSCLIQAVLGCLVISDPSLNQEAMKIMRIAQRICKCLVAYATRLDLISHQPQFYSAVLNSIILAKCIEARLWENSPFVSKQLKGIGPTFSTLLATAGKVNFMLLEESHPRDLERIMNKGAPAGNVIRKQVSLLPKYQLSMIPVDERTVNLQLVLLNQNYLSENIEQLTAGSNHKSYIVVGDSNNNLLLLTSFKDKDLISVFDGTISYELRRKHNSEHKIFAYCVSTTFVGIDVQSEYLFNNLNPYFGEPSASFNLIKDMTVKETVKKQTCITDTFKERKRKSTTDIDKTQSKEKKKRDNTIIESFKYLKKTFEHASKNMKDNVNISNISYKLPNDTIPEKYTIPKDTVSDALIDINNEINAFEDDIDSDDCIDNQKVDSILTEIEKEMSKKKENSLNSNSSYSSSIQKIDTATSLSSNIRRDTIGKTPVHVNTNRYNTFKKRKSLTNKSNYSFIELLERNLSISDDDEKTVASNENNGFSDTIKSHINKYIQKTESKSNPSDTVHLLLENDDKVILNTSKNSNEIIVVDSDTEELPPTQKLSPYYEIKEILDGTNTIESNINITETENTNLSTSLEKFHLKQSSEETKLLSTDLSIIPTHKNDLIIPLVSENHTHTTNNICKSISNESFSNKGPIKDNLNLTKDEFQKDVNQSVDVQEYLVKSYVDDNVDMATNSLGHDLNTVNDDHRERSELIPRTNQIDNDELRLSDDLVNILIENNQDETYNARDRNNLHLIPFQNTNTNKIYQYNPYNAPEEYISTCIATKAVGVKEKSLLPSFTKVLYENTEIKKYSTIENVFRKDIIGIRNIPCNEDRNSSRDASILQTDTDPIIASNLVASKNNRNSQSYLMNNSLTTQLTYCSNYIDGEFNQNASNAKKYSYSATKIDVCSSQTPEYCVQVIKQIKVDLNITKVVSTNKSQSRDMPFKEYEFDDKNKTENIRDTKYDKLTKLNYDSVQGYSKDMNELPPTMYTEQSARSHLQKDTTDNLNSHEFPNTKITLGNINEKHMAREKSEHANGNSTVQNILQKYSNIFGKDNAKIQMPTISTINRNIACNKSSTSKSKKPFKISDIQKLNAALPNTIIDCNEHEQNIPTFRKFANEKTIIKENLQSDHHVPSYNVSLKAKDNPCQSITDIDLELLNISSEFDLETITEVKIDQSMFDPKTLLQSTLHADSVEIIPPPSPFCDYTSDYGDNEDSNTADDYCEISQLSDSTDKDTTYNTSIFEDQCIAHLTPSREIETWTLDKEDCWEDQYASPIPAQSFTVIRRNTPNCFNTSEKSGNRTSRQAKLGQFKFNHKKKLRKWKWNEAC